MFVILSYLNIKSSSLGIVKNHVIEELNNNFRFHEIFQKI